MPITTLDYVNKDIGFDLISLLLLDSPNHLSSQTMTSMVTIKKKPYLFKSKVLIAKSPKILTSREYSTIITSFFHWMGGDLFSSGWSYTLNDDF